MGRSNKNTYAKALKHLKSTHEEVTYSMLDEAAPTNSTSGLYRLEPDEIIIDPNGADPVDFGEDPAAWEAMMQELLGDYVAYDGTDTSGLFESDGRIRTIEPPGDTSYVLGPMSAMWYSWGNFTQIGYIRQSDRRMVNLARITGQLGSWDGESDFTSYGQLTLEQAVWFRDAAKKDGADNDTPNYRAFYPGPPSNPADEYGRYLAVIVGESKPPAKTVRTGDHGSAQDAGFPWFNVPDSQLTPEQRRRRRQFDTMRSGITDLESFMDAWARRWGGTEGPNAPNAPAEGKWWMSMLRLVDAGMSYAAASQALGLDNFLDKNFPDAGKTTRRGQGGRELGDTTRRGDGPFTSPLTGEPLDLERVGQNPQLYSRVLRSLTDNIRYGGGSIVTGLPSGITYDPNYRSSMKLQRWAKPRNYGAPLGTFNPGELNVSRMYMEPAGSPTRGTPFGNKSGAYWVQDAPKKGLPGIKNPFASTVNRGWSGTPEVQIPQGGPRAVQASADDVAKLASKGAKTSKVLSRLVPGVAIAAAVADVGTRIAEGDYAGAVLGGVSAIPGPIGWVGFGAQMLYDVTGAKQNMPYNRLKEAVSDEQWKPEVMEHLNSLDKDEYIRTLAAMLLQEGINPELISLTVRSFYNAELEDSEIKFIETSLPKLIKIFQQDKTNPKLPKRTKKVSSVDEHTSNVIKNIKKPVTIKEVKQERVKRRPRVIGSDSNSKTINSGLMKQAEVPTSFKKPEDRMWGKYERMQNERASQERKNQVLDHLGGSDHAWEYMLNRNASKRNIAGYFDKDGTPKTIFPDGKVKTVTREEKVGSDTLIFYTDENGKKGSILQSEYNDIQDKTYTQQMFAEYEEAVAAEKENTFDKIVSRVQLKADKNPSDDKIQSMLSSYRALSHLKKEDKKHEAHFVSWRDSITDNVQSWIDSIGQETADAVTKVALAEKMSSSNLFGTSLPATGENINATVNMGSADSFFPDETEIPASRFGIDTNHTTSHNQPSNVFPGFSGGDDVLYFATPISETGGLASSPDYFFVTTNPMKLENDTVSFRAIAGNSVGHGNGAGMGSNGGSQPSQDLSVWWFSYEDGVFADGGPLGTVPKNTHSSTEFEFTFPANLVGKQVAINFFTDANQGGNESDSFLQGFSIPWHPLGSLDERTDDSSSFLAWVILNYDTFAGQGYAEDSKRTLASSLWNDLQGHYTSTSGWNQYQSYGNPGAPAPVSGSTYAFGTEHPETFEDIGATTEDLDYIINWIETNMSHLRGQTTTTYAITGLNFKRKAPMNVFVPLDSPEAVNFIRTAPEMAGLTPAQRLKKLKQMLASGNEYLIKMLGFQGSTATPGGDEVAQALPYTDEDDAFDNPYYKDPFKDPGDLDDSDDESTWDYAKNKGDTEVAASYPTTNTPLDKVGGFKGLPKGKGWYPVDKNGNPYNPQTGLPVKV